MQGPSEEPKLDRPTLEKNGIFYFDWPSASSRWNFQWLEQYPETKSCRDYLARRRPRYASDLTLVPNFVSSLRELLLDNSKLIPSHAEEHLHASERAEIPEGVIFNDEDYAILPLKEKEDAKAKFARIF